jgi:DNA-binding winged helix-turn-helix (wHTH) protein
VSAEDAKAFAAKYNMTYIETSAKSGYNVGRAFQTIVEHVHRKQKAAGDEPPPGAGGFSLGAPPAEKSWMDENPCC